MIDAIPVTPKPVAPVARNGHGADGRILVDIAVAVAVVAAITALIPDTGGPLSDDEQRQYERNMGLMRQTTVEWPCINSGGTMNAIGSCSH